LVQAEQLDTEGQKNSLFNLLQIGRWMAQIHPEATKPEHWDYGVAADFVGAVDQMRVGDWSPKRTYPSYFSKAVGKPLTPRAKASFLQVTRSFFLDLQDTAIRLGNDEAASIRALRFVSRLPFTA
jgi:hypothetical protein